MPDNPLETIISRATGDIRKLLEEAFEAGRNDMRRELTVFLAGAPLGIPRVEAHTVIGGIAPSPNEGRAPVGTVKPTIKAVITEAPNGIRTSEIIEKTGFKENSVRGTLSTLKDEGFAERRGDLWYLSQRKGPQVEASGPS
jgi:hypothetical protein